MRRCVIVKLGELKEFFIDKLNMML